MYYDEAYRMNSIIRIYKHFNEYFGNTNISPFGTT